jgi:hypothetical protein
MEELSANRVVGHPASDSMLVSASLVIRPKRK